MKTRNLIAGSLVLMGLAVLVPSCNKDNEATGSETYVVDQKMAAAKEQAIEWTKKIPAIHVYDKKNDRVITVNMNEKNFDFSDPNSGWNFSNDEDVAWSNNPNGGGILFVGSDSFGGNTGGTVVAGDAALDINYTFCFSASDEALGLDLFDFGGDFTGVSVVLGIAGDFEALQDGNVDEDADFNDFFQGFAMYIVYAEQAQGSYDVLNWFEDLDEDPDDLAGGSFGYLIDFTEPGGVFFTSGGTFTVSGGSINFNGEYFGLLDFLLSFDEDEDDFEFDIVDGFGAMGC